MTLLLIPKGVILSERPCNHAEVVKSREAAVFRRLGLPREKYGMFDWRTRTRTVKRRLVKHHIIFGCALTNETDRDCCLAENKWLTDELLHRQGRGERLKTWTSHHFAHIECTRMKWGRHVMSCVWWIKPISLHYRVWYEKRLLYIHEGNTLRASYFMDGAL